VFLVVVMLVHELSRPLVPQKRRDLALVTHHRDDDPTEIAEAVSFLGERDGIRVVRISFGFELGIV